MLPIQKSDKGCVITSAAVELRMAADIFIFNKEIAERLVGDVDMLELMDLENFLLE